VVGSSYIVQRLILILSALKIRPIQLVQCMACQKFTIMPLSRNINVVVAIVVTYHRDTGGTQRMSATLLQLCLCLYVCV